MELSKFLDPVDALAYHFKSFGAEPAAKKKPLRIPPSLQSQLNERLGSSGLDGISIAPYCPRTITNLVSSISDEDFERWCLLDATAFIFVTRVLLEAEPCLAKDQGFFRLIEALETLRDQSSELSMPERLLTIYKNTIGESLAAKLLDTFIDCEESGFSRRWTGMLLVELLEESEANKDRVWKMPDKLFKDIGEVIVSGDDRMLKIVAGKIIWQLMQAIEDEEEIRQRLPTFCQSNHTGDFIKGFPLQGGSQWESGFASFINEIELNRYDLNFGPPNGYVAIQVMLGNNSPISADIGAISINIAEIFSIYIPPNADRSPDWVDLKIVNISKIEFTKEIKTGDLMDDLMYFKLHLHDYDKDGYLYLLSMRPSSDSNNITILCYKSEVEDFAEDIEKCREKVLLRKSRRQISSAPLRDIQANPEYRQSQQEKINELERHREDILKVLESPTAKSDDEYASSLTDPDEFDDGWDMSPAGCKPVEPQEGEGSIKGRESKTPGVGSMAVGVLEEAILVSPAKKPSTPEIMKQGRRIPISYPKDSNGTSDVILESSFPAPAASSTNPKSISGVTSEGFSLSPRTSLQSQKLQMATKPDFSPRISPQPPRVISSNYQKGLEEVFEILKGKTPSELWDSPRHPTTVAEEQAKAKLSTNTPIFKKPPIPKKKQEDIHKPKLANSTELLKNSSKGLPVDEESAKSRSEYIDITAVDNLQKRSEDHSLLSISEKHPSQNVPVKENRVPIAVKNKPKGAVGSAVLSIPDDPKKFRALPDTYGTKNRARGEPKPKGKALNKDDPPNKSKLQVMTTKSTKTRAPSVKLDKEKMLPSDDASIWELPVSEESEKETRNSKKKGTTRLKDLSLKKPASKTRQPTKPKPPPKKRVYGKKSVANPEPKSKEIISDSDKEAEVESPAFSPARKQKQNPRLRDKDCPKAMPDGSIFDQDSENEPEDKVVAHSLRPKVKPRPKPKSRSAPASGLANRILPKHNEDEQMESSEGEFIRPSTPPTPTPNPRKEPAKLVPAERTAFEKSNDEHARPSSRKIDSKMAFKSVSTLRSAKHNQSKENWLEPVKQNNPPTYSTKVNEAVEVIPASVLAKRAAPPDINGDNANRENTGPQNKRKKQEQSNIGQTTEKARQQPLSKKALENSKKRFKSNAPLNTSEADQDSSWRPKTRLQAKLELAKKSVETKMIKKTIGVYSSEDSADRVKIIGKSPKKGSRRVVRRRTVLSSESSEDDVKEAPQRKLGAISLSEKNCSPLEDDIDSTPSNSSSSESEVKRKTSIGRVIFDDGAPKLNEYRSNKELLPTESTKASGENQAPTAVMSLEVSNTHYISERSKKPPENHFQGSALLLKRNREALLTSATPIKTINVSKTPKVHSGPLIDDHLARKAQIISWGSDGPKNQGRTPVVEKVNIGGAIREDILSIDNEECSEEDPSLSTMGRDLSLFIIASDDEDRIVTRKKAKSSPLIRLGRSGTETVVGTNRSPLMAPIRQDSEPAELLGDNGSSNESRNSSPASSQDGSDTASDLEMEDTRKDDQEFPVIQDRNAPENNDSEDEPLKGVLQVEQLTTKEEKVSVTHRRPPSKQGFNVIVLSSSSSESEDEAKNWTQRNPSKRCSIKPESKFRDLFRDFKKTGNSFSTAKESLKAPNGYVAEKSDKEWGGHAVPAQSPKTFIAHNQELHYFRGNPRDAILNPEPKATSTVAKDTTLEANFATELSAAETSMGRKNQKTNFSRWLQESGFKKVANDSHDNRSAHHVPKIGLQSRDPDKTLVNKDGHDESETGQERGQKRQGNNRGKRMLGKESDDSDTDTSDYEDSDTDDEDEEDEEDEESSEDDDLEWRQSVPDYHRESLSVLNQISRGLLRYLMSSEELAIEIINDFEKQGKEIVERLGASHKREYEEFLIRVKLGKEKVQMEHAKIMEVVEEDLTNIRKRSEVLADVRAKLGKEHETLDVTILTMMASLEEELEKPVP